MATSFNLSSIFSSAWAIVKSEGISISSALKRAWAEAKASVIEIIETISIETYKYAGKLANGFKETLVQLYWKDRKAGVLGASWGEVSYPNFPQKGKQNDCIITAESGAAISIDQKGRTELMGLAEKWLLEANTVEGTTFDVKDEIKKFGYKWDGSTKSWKK